MVLPTFRVPLAGDSTSDDMVGPLWARPLGDRLATLPAPSVIVAALRSTAVAEFWPAVLGVVGGSVCEAEVVPRSEELAELPAVPAIVVLLGSLTWVPVAAAGR